ncbi:sensor histidine kinase [Sphingomonas pituitosa]|uniref:sensor histidine kinase n=1 Tax=Sphingomonas pituitosa TaxID=99597 RepID=UPI000A0698BF|nr:HAMP domain-containing sensor histidine kinase [Sphingomonas pituitosa]
MARAWPHRSMFGQMALLTLLLVALGVYVLAIRPILDVLPPSAFDPLDVSAQKVSETINAEIWMLDGHPDRAVSREFQAVMTAARQRNPGFRYYIRVGDRTLGNLSAPVYFERTGLARLEAVRRQTPVPSLCMQMFENLSTAGSIGKMEYIYCASPRYYEYFGLQHPFPTDIDRTDRAFRKIFWSYSDRFLLSVGAVFALVSLVILFNMWTIRRVARVAQSFDGNRLDLQLPEKGIPQEVLPLVRAVNQLIGRLATTQARQKFFLSAAAHEMRTPLTVLRTRLELLDEAPIKDKLIGDVRRLTNLVNQLLTLMKINTLLEVEGTIDLVASTRKVIASLGPLAAPRGIAISFAPQSDAFPVVGSAELIEVAIANLIDNALSFTPDGGEVFVALDADGLLSVRDFGPGIDPAKAVTLFEPFVRHPSNRRGHGLGLAIVKAVVTLHGGTVAARNAEGAGAVFELRLPNDPDPRRTGAANAATVRIPSFDATF